jgi:DNA polymerase III subunit delta
MAASKNETTVDQVYRDLKNKIYRPVYFFWGDEPYYIDRLTDYMMHNILTEAEKSFNLTVIYGKDSDASAVINNARRFPMMANYQLVIVKEAQELKNFDDLIHYVKSPLKSTILVINYKYKPPDKRKSIYKALVENAEILESKKMYDNKIPDWIAGQLSRKNYQIEGKAAYLLSEFLGNDLSRISNELDKLIIVLGENKKIISSADIEKNIGISKEYNNFELQSALASRDVLKANRIINYFADNQKTNNIVVTLSVLYLFFSKILIYHSLSDKSRNIAAAALKINPYYISEYEQAAKYYTASKAKKCISLLREYDLKSKGYGNTSAEAGDLLKELIFKILH